MHRSRTIVALRLELKPLRLVSLLMPLTFIHLVASCNFHADSSLSLSLSHFNSDGRERPSNVLGCLCLLRAESKVKEEYYLLIWSFHTQGEHVDIFCDLKSSSILSMLKIVFRKGSCHCTVTLAVFLCFRFWKN